MGFSQAGEELCDHLTVRLKIVLRDVTSCTLVEIFPKLSRNVRPPPSNEKMEACLCLKFLSLYQTAWCYVPEDNFKSQFHIMLPLDMRNNRPNEPGGLVNSLRWEITGLVSAVPDISFLNLRLRN
jgi:hypothetical protein